MTGTLQATDRPWIWSWRWALHILFGGAIGTYCNAPGGLCRPCACWLKFATGPARAPERNP